MLDIKVISLLAVAQTKNFTKAANALSLTQPAVSHHISQLEKELGVKIFIRGKGALILTPEGEIILKYAKRMHAMYDKLKASLADMGKYLTKLRIGITHTAESNVVAEVLAKFSNENPGVIITVITDTIKNLYAMLENYELDLAIVEGKPTASDLNSLMLDTDYLVCVASIENPLSKKAMVTLHDLQKEKMILRLPKAGTVNLFASHLASINKAIDNFNVILEVDNIATIKDLIRKNLGVSILPISTCMDELRKGKISVLPIENLSMVRETNIVYQKDFSHTEILQDILELYRQTVKAQNQYL